MTLGRSGQSFKSLSPDFSLTLSVTVGAYREETLLYSNDVRYLSRVHTFQNTPVLLPTVDNYATKRGSNNVKNK